MNPQLDPQLDPQLAREDREPAVEHVSRSLHRAVIALDELRRTLEIEVDLASSDVRSAYRALAPELDDLERYLDGSEESVAAVRALLSRAVELHDRLRHARCAR